MGTDEALVSKSTLVSNLNLTSLIGLINFVICTLMVPEAQTCRLESGYFADPSQLLVCSTKKAEEKPGEEPDIVVTAISVCCGSSNLLRVKSPCPTGL